MIILKCSHILIHFQLLVLCCGSVCGRITQTGLILMLFIAFVITMTPYIWFNYTTITEKLCSRAFSAPNTIETVFFRISASKVASFLVWFWFCQFGVDVDNIWNIPICLSRIETVKVSHNTTKKVKQVTLEFRV